jgi:hypothetical protein
MLGILGRMSCFYGCVVNELLALHNRHLVRRLEPEQRTVRAVAQHWLSKLPRYNNILPWTETQVIEHTVQSKKQRVRDAFALYHKFGWLKKDSYIRMFIKHEKGNDMPESPAEQGDPRAIQYRSFKHTSLFKKFLMPVEIRLWKYGQNLEERSPLNERLFSKNLNPLAVAANLYNGWSKFAKPMAHLWDVSRMDAHMGRFLRELIEFPTYRNVMPAVQPFLEVMRRNRGFSKNGIQYEMEYTMCSGEACTSSGDSIVMAAVLDYVYRDIPHHKLVCGDDSVVIFDQDHVKRIDQNIFKECGLPVKLEEAFLLEHVEFCQTRPVQVAGRWMMVRNPERVVLRGFHTIKNFTGHALRDWIASVGVGELECSAGVPIAQSFALRAMEMGSPRPHFVRDFLEHRRTCGFKEPAVVQDTTRQSFWLAWGVSPSVQLAIEAACQTAEML